MTQTDTNRRNKWADRIELCLDSGMSVEEWCKLNHFSRSALYSWLAKFRKEEPGRFPRRNSATSNWLEVTRGGIADAKSIVPAASGSSPMEPAASAGRANSPAQPTSRAAEEQPTPSQPICAIANGVRILVPPGSAEPDVACVLRAAMSL